MPAIPQSLVEGWAQLIDLATALNYGDPLAATDQPYVFRGHEDADWALQSTLQRAATRDGELPTPSAAELLAIEKRLTARFRAMAPMHLSPATLAATNADVDWW
jgi:hypothetical protein